MDKEPTQKLSPLRPQPPYPAPARKRRKPWSKKKRITISVVLLFFLLLGGIGAYAFYYIEANILLPLSHFIHPVRRGAGEPQLPSYDEGPITGHPWNILLLGSDNNQR